MDPTIIQHLSRSAGKPMVIKCPHFIPFQKSLILRNQWYPLSGQSHSRKSGRRRRAPCHYLPVIPHKVVAEVLKIDNYRRGELFWCMDGRANPLMDRKVVGVVLFGVVSVVTSPTTAECYVVWCYVVVVCSCSCSLVAVAVAAVVVLLFNVVAVVVVVVV